MELRKRPQDGISRVQKVAAVKLGFRGAPGCLGGTWTYIGGRSRSVEQRGAHEGEEVGRWSNEGPTRVEGAPTCLVASSIVS